jgi:putative copper export protein
MARTDFLRSHRTWEDYVGVFLAVLIAMSPLIVGEATNHVPHNSFLEYLIGKPTDHAVMLNATVVGSLVLLLASLELVHLNRSEEAIEFLCGGWLIASPFVFGYAGAGELRWWHFSLGALVAILALFELWQDWKLSDEDLARHGQ